MKKKLFLLIAVLVAAAVLVSGCSTDALKERVPGVKANVSMLLADNDEGDLEYEVGEVVQDFDEESSDSGSSFGSFGADLISDVETEVTGLSAVSEFDLLLPTEFSDLTTAPDDYTGSFNEEVIVDLTAGLDSNNDVSSLLENIIFEDAQLELIIKDSSTDTTKSDILSLDDITIVKSTDKTDFGTNTDDPGVIDLSGAELGLSDELEIDFGATIDLEQGDTIPSQPVLEVNLTSSEGTNVKIASIDVNLDNEVLSNIDNYEPEIDEVLIEEYEKDEFIDSVEIPESEMYIDFTIPDGINLDLSGVSVKSFGKNGDEISSASEISVKDSKAYLPLADILSMLKDEDTYDIKIMGAISLTSSGTEATTITKNTELDINKAVLESAEIEIDYEMEPEQLEESLTNNEVEDIKNSLEQIELVLEGLNNPLPAELEGILFIAEAGDDLYTEANQLISFKLDKNYNDDKIIILNKDKYDRFVGNNLEVGVKLVSNIKFTRKEYEGKIVSIDKIKANFNIDVNADDFE